LSINKPLFLAPLPGSKLVYIVWFAFNLVLYLVYLLFAISNTYYLENHFVLSLFLFLSYFLYGVRQSTRDELEKSLRDYASPRCEDIRVQESDSKLEVTK
jgi:hypothetical protein